MAVEAEVLRLAGVAAGAGAHGIVCSGHEVAAVRAAFGERLAPLVPGLRLAGGAAHDQARVVTPAAAAAAGARYLVLGRAVTATADPAAAMRGCGGHWRLDWRRRSISLPGRGDQAHAAPRTRPRARCTPATRNPRLTCAPRPVRLGFGSWPKNLYVRLERL